MQAQILTFAIPAIMAIIGGLLLALWLRSRANTPLLAFAGWSFAFGTSIAIAAIGTEKYAPFNLIAYHWILSLGTIALAWGVAKRDRQPTPVAAMTGLTILITPVLYIARNLDNSAVVVMAQNFHMALIFALAAQAKWYAPTRNIGDRALLAAFVLSAIYSIVRPATTALMLDRMSVAAYKQTTLWSLDFVLSALCAFLIAMSLLISIVIEKMQHDRRRAMVDALTGLPNRAAFESQTVKALARATDERIPVSLIIGDIDHFKQVNDTWGHSVGDKVIATFGSVVSRKIRPRDIAGRVGGEEFCIFVWNCPEQGAAALAERLRLGLAGEVVNGFGPNQRFTASFGVAGWKRGESYTQLFERADAALYRAKGAGRNRVSRASETGDAASPRSRSDSADMGAAKNLAKNVASLDEYRARF